MESVVESFEQPVVAFVQGASRGIGLGLVERLLRDDGVEKVWASSRAPYRSEGLSRLSAEFGDRLGRVAMDVTDEGAVAAAARQITEGSGRVDLLLNVTGLLHDERLGVSPEKSLRDLDLTRMRRSFEVNAIGPGLVIKHMHGAMRHGRRAVIANLSARVGSIGDNRIGGWYAYRASKAAQNQITKTASIELRRKAPALVCVALHPGTVDTDLSAPFQGNVPEGKLFSVERAARQLLEVIDGLGPDDTGRFFDWAGEPVEW
jgi:NAD(P)-dependent dehydrogenase (short-subunit alcohol dehydrogenase family)